MLRFDIALRDREEARDPALRGEQVVVARVERSVTDPEADREELADRVEDHPELGLLEQPLGELRDALEAPGEGRLGPGLFTRLARREEVEIAGVAGDRPAERLRPRPELAVRSVAALGERRRGDVGEGPGKGPELRQPVRPRTDLARLAGGAAPFVLLATGA